MALSQLGIVAVLQFCRVFGYLQQDGPYARESDLGYTVALGMTECFPMQDVYPPIRLLPVFQHYDWGTQQGIGELLNLNVPRNQPVAELWMGAHAGLPSPLVEPTAGTTHLDALIAQDPTAILGAQHALMRDQLPYLFKVLSAEQALSVQVHPSKAQAEEGFAAENAQGKALADPTRNYKDDNHKPELLVALTEFHAMAGFRQPDAVADRLAQLSSTDLLAWVEPLREQGLPALAELYAWLLQRPQTEVETIVQDAMAVLPDGPEFAWMAQLHQQYGADMGIFFPLVLNYLVLQPGEAIYLDAGIPHAYLRGTGLEVMASSDNVLRGGLTSKHMDVPELLRITNVLPDSVQVQAGVTEQGVTRFDIPCTDFDLRLIDLSEGTVTLGCTGSAELLLVLSGDAEVADQTVQQGDILLLPACLGEVRLRGNARLAVVGTRITEIFSDA